MELVVVLVVFGLLLGVLYVAASGCRILKDKSELEKKQLGDLHQALMMAEADAFHRAQFENSEMRDLTGRTFYEACFRRGILDRELLTKIASLNSEAGDSVSDSAWIDEGRSLDESACSYTSPRAGELSEVLHASGADRCAAIAFDSRNWNNYPDKGVVVAWSEGGVDYFTEAAAGDYGLSPEDWAQPGARILGRRAPFQRTHE